MGQRASSRWAGERVAGWRGRGRLHRVRIGCPRDIVLGEVIPLAFSDRDTTTRQRLARRVTLPGLLITVPCLFTMSVVLVGCAPASETLSSVEVPSSAAASASPGPSQPVPDADPAVEDCNPDVAAAAFDVVQRQQRAFADEDFAGALRLASTGFQSSVTLPQFTALIASGYGFLLTTQQLRMTECTTDDTTAVLRVGVGNDAVLAYRMVAEDDEWRIDGASILKEISA